MGATSETFPLLEAREIGKEYRLPHQRVQALRAVSLSVFPGERVAIVGRSGAGKSTLLHVLGGLERPETGTVRLGGTDLYALSARRRTTLRARRVGYVFQAYHLLPDMDVVENVLLPSMALGHGGRRVARRRAMELLEQVGLADRMAHMPLELSGGEQQRVAIARALMNRPDLLLADEPTGNLDPATGQQMLDLLFGMVRDGGNTLAIVTHDRSVAGRCSRILTLRDGRLEDDAIDETAKDDHEPDEP